MYCGIAVFNWSNSIYFIGHTSSRPKLIVYFLPLMWHVLVVTCPLQTSTIWCGVAPHWDSFGQGCYKLPLNLTVLPKLESREAGALGLFKRLKWLRVVVRFLDLALLKTKCAITIKWKSPSLPIFKGWSSDVLRLAKAKRTALHREEAWGVQEQHLDRE